MRLSALSAVLVLSCSRPSQRQEPREDPRHAAQDPPPAAAPVASAADSGPGVPYPFARSLVGEVAAAPAPDSDCSGMIDVGPEYVDGRGRKVYRDGAWSVGDVDPDGYYPVLYFNSQSQASACRGTSDLIVRTWRGGDWRSADQRVP